MLRLKVFKPNLNLIQAKKKYIYCIYMSQSNEIFLNRLIDFVLNLH